MELDQIDSKSPHPEGDRAKPASSSIEDPNFKHFKGSESFVTIDGENSSRTQLPFLRPANEKINMWHLFSKLFG
jgi:hypothetical protein